MDHALARGDGHGAGLVDAGVPRTFKPIGETRVRSSKERLRLKLYLALLIVDLTAILIGFSTANFVRFGSFSGLGMALGFGCMPIFVALAFSGACYSHEVLMAPRIGVRRALKALVFTAGGLLIALYSAKTAEDVSRLVFALGLGVSVGVMGVARYGLGQVAGHASGWNFKNEVLLVDGVNVFPSAGQIVVFANQMGISATSNDPTNFSRLGRLLANCDRVTLAAAPEKRALWVSTLKCAGIAVEVSTPELDGFGVLEYRQYEGKSTLLVSVGPLALKDRMLKRSLDLVVATLGLLFAALPMILIALAVKLTSQGPVFFRQPRVGQGNRIFNVYKFRTMRVDASDEAGSRSASRTDDRITRVGGFLRKTSLDELPQLFNVILGSMSIVGPRPHALGSTAGSLLFWDADPRYWQRGAVRPGITGLAQVRGFRGATREEVDLVKRVQADLDYLLGWSIWRDLRIIFQTAKVLVHANAY